MTAKEYLEQAHRSDVSVELLNCELENIKERMKFVEKLKPDNAGVMNSDFDKLFSQMKDEYKLTTGKLIAQQNKAIELRREIHEDISCLDELEFQLLEKRYFDNIIWDDIAEALYFSIRYTFKLHNEALSKLEKNISKKLANYAKAN